MSLQEFTKNFLEAEEEGSEQGKINPLLAMRNISSFERTIDVTVPAIMSKSAPPFGPSLAQCGVNVSNFCEDYNELCEEEELMEEFPVPVRVYLRQDKTYEMVLRTPTLFSMGEAISPWNRAELNIDRDYYRYNRLILFLNRRRRLERMYNRRLQRKVNQRRVITLLDLYKMFCMKMEEIKYYENSSEEGVLKTIVSYFKKEKYFFKIEEDYYETKDYIREKWEYRKTFLVAFTSSNEGSKISKGRRTKKRGSSGRRRGIYFKRIK
jgi:Ribosomal protein L11, N-terminal domain